MNESVTSKSSEANLINLLDNVHLSSRNNGNNKEKQLEDYQMRMLQEFCSTSHVKKQDCLTSKIDEAQLASFFDKYEKPRPEPFKEQYKQLNTEELHKFEQCNEKNDDKNNKYGLIDDEIVNKFANNVSLFDSSTPRVLIPKLKILNEPIAERVNEKAEIINEDLIEEVMFEQQMEKLYNKKVNSEKLEIPQTSRTTKPVQETHEQVDFKNSIDNLLDEIITKNQVKVFAKPALTKNVNYTKEEPLHSIITTEKTKSQQKALTEELVTRYDIKYLETVKKNDKAFRSSAFKSDAEKLNLTVGPSLHEKSVVLPQIMQRIKERQREVEGRSGLEMRLILDSGSDKGDIQKLSEPQVLMSDCNKERLKACEAAKMFNSYVCSGTSKK